MTSWTTYVFTSMALSTVLSSKPRLLTLNSKRFTHFQMATAVWAVLSFMGFFCVADLLNTPFCR